MTPPRVWSAGALRPSPYFNPGLPLHRGAGNKSAAAKLLGITRNGLAL